MWFKILIFGILILPVISFAQDEDIFEELREGIVVDVILKNGSRFRGTILTLTTDTLRLRIEEENFSGEMAFDKDEISMVVTTIPMFTPVEKEKKPEIPSEGENESVGSKTKRTKTEETEITDEELMSAFPPEDGWGREKFIEIIKKPENERTVEEVLFVENFERWQNVFEKYEIKALLEKFPTDSWSEEIYFNLKAKPLDELSDSEREFVEKFDLWKKGADELKTQKYEYLLKKFPPEEGWNEKKLNELKTKFIRIDVPPTKDEQEFIDNYEIWLKAVEEKKKKSEEEAIEKELMKKEEEEEATE